MIKKEPHFSSPFRLPKWVPLLVIAAACSIGLALHWMNTHSTLSEFNEIKSTDEGQLAHAPLDDPLTSNVGLKSNLRQQSGQLTVICFWASWCPPCQEEIPGLLALQDQFKPDQIRVILLNKEPADEQNNARKFLNSKFHRKISYWTDYDDRWANHFKVEGLPTNLIIDRAGRTLFYTDSKIDWQSPKAQAFVTQLLNKQQAAAADEAKTQ